MVFVRNFAPKVDLKATACSNLVVSACVTSHLLQTKRRPADEDGNLHHRGPVRVRESLEDLGRPRDRYLDHSR